MSTSLESLKITSTTVNQAHDTGSSANIIPVRAFSFNQIVDKVGAIIDGTLQVASTLLTFSSVTPATAGSGTGVQIPMLEGPVYASPTTLTAAQSGAICNFGAAAGSNFTLPAATAAIKGVTYKFIVTTTVTSNADEVFAASSADLMVGSINMLKGSVDAVTFSANGSSNYKVSMNGSTTGGIKGGTFTVTCGGLNLWYVEGIFWGSGTVASPFTG